MEALGGIRTREAYDDSEYAKCMVVYYSIDVKKALEDYKDIYEPRILRK